MQVWIDPAIILIFNLLMSFLDKRCLIPLPDTEKPTILATTNTSFTLSLPSVAPQQLCPGISQPTPTYLVFYNQMTNICRNSRHCLSAPQQKRLVWLLHREMHVILSVNREYDYQFQWFYEPFCSFLSASFSISTFSNSNCPFSLVYGKW